MTYDPNIPQAASRISDTQFPIFTNFNQANTIVGIDHFEFNNGNAGDRGMHKQSTYPALPIAGGFPVAVPTPIVGNGCIYTRPAPAGAGNPTIPYYRKDNLVTDYPVIPIRAMGRFVTSPMPVVGAPIVPVGTPFNFNLPATVRAPDFGGLQVIQFTFNEAMPDANYLPMITFLVSVPPQFFIDTILNTGFRVHASAASFAASPSFSLIVLHYTI